MHSRYLDIDEDRRANINEEIFIPQHPNGYSKKISTFDSHHNDGCRIHTYETDGCSPNDMVYFCDTEGGSSGSPVISKMTGKVVAIHNCGDNGNCEGNAGSPTHDFWHEISRLLKVRRVT